MTITIISLLTTIGGVLAILPQISRMLRHRSAQGQSPVGWALGALTNAGMLLVNTQVYDNRVLAAGNLMSLLGCLVAVILTWRYHPRRSAPSISPQAHVVWDEMPTQELVLLHDAILKEKERRAARREFMSASGYGAE